MFAGIELASIFHTRSYESRNIATRNNVPSILKCCQVYWKSAIPQFAFDLFWILIWMSSHWKFLVGYVHRNRRNSLQKQRMHHVAHIHTHAQPNLLSWDLESHSGFCRKICDSNVLHDKPASRKYSVETRNDNLFLCEIFQKPVWNNSIFWVSWIGPISSSWSFS